MLVLPGRRGGFMMLILTEMVSLKGMMPLGMATDIVRSSRTTSNRGALHKRGAAFIGFGKGSGAGGDGKSCATMMSTNGLCGRKKKARAVYRGIDFIKIS